MRSILFTTLATLSLLFTGPVLAEFTSADAAALEAESTAALNKFQSETSGAKSMLDSANGILICPKITKGGFVIGVEGGKCQMRVAGKGVGYYRTRAAKVGWLVGVQSYSMILVFNQDAALKTFMTGDREWEVGVDASVAIAKVGATGKLDTTNLQQAIVGFVFGEKGLMADLSLEGSNFKKIAVID